MNLFLAESRPLRFFSFSIYYIAQGLPIGLLSIALPAWLSQNNVSSGDIASFIAVSGLPWAFKFFAGPIMDRYSFLPMGRRRLWIILSQFGLVLSMIAMAFVPDPTNNIVLLTGMAFLANTFAASQDVAVDGMAIDVLPVDERGRANSFMAFGQVSGYAASGALSAAALQSFGLFGAALGLAVGLVAIFIWGILVRERRGERILPWTEGEALDRSISLRAENWIGIANDLRLVFFLKASLLLILVTLAWRVSAGFWLVSAPVIAVQELGHESTIYSYWTSTFQLAAAAAGLILGPVIDRIGTRRILFVAMSFQGALFLITGLCVEYWTNPVVPLTVAALESVSSQAIFICFIAMHMSICWNRVSATQFAIYMAWANLARSIGAKLYGMVDPHLLLGQEFIVMAGVTFLGAAVLTLLRLDQHREALENLDQRFLAGKPA